MPVKSYLAYPQPGGIEALVSDLGELKGCEIHPSSNRDLVVVLTDTADAHEEELLRERLQQLSSLKYLALVAGFETS